MKRAFSGRGLRATAALAAASTAALSGVGAVAHAATHASANSPTPCVSKVKGPTRVGRFGGIVRAVEFRTNCQVHNTSDAANGTPPLLFHGGQVMGTKSTGPVVVTPIFWNPAGHTMTSSYKKIITNYFSDVAAASGQHSNVYSTLNEYFGSNGDIRYRIELGTPINDTNALPQSGCILNHKDMKNIYADKSGYNACLDDAQVVSETDRLITARHLPRDYGHIYMTFLPKQVESCFYGGSTATLNNFCTINHQLSAAYCAYHSQASSGTVYANMPYAIYASPVGYTCGSDARFPAIQSPNGNPYADTEISAASHELMESITDPDTATGWYDSSGYENGDECAYVYGSTQGTPGQLYNQVIGKHHYLTQEEFSNKDFFNTGLGCVPNE